MAVNLSFIGGAGWQFFDDNGNPLSGGKIFTYEAGTTTPLTTYTSRSGLVANTNPIILDAAGRTPAQIWATEGLLYKYVVKTSTDVLIRTWDDIGGSVVSSNLAQDLANTTDNAKGDALVGFKQANSLGFYPNAVSRTVSTKLQECISVKDFGAVGDGATDDTVAIQAAVDALGTTGGVLLFPNTPNGYKYSIVTIKNSNITLDFDNNLVNGRLNLIPQSLVSSGRLTGADYPSSWRNGATPKPMDGDFNTMMHESFDAYRLKNIRIINMRANTSCATEPIYAFSVDGLTVENCNLQPLNKSAVRAFHCSQINLLNNVLGGSGTYTVFGFKCCLLTITGNYFVSNNALRALSFKGAMHEDGRSIFEDFSASPTYYRCFQGLVANNHFFGGLDGVFWDTTPSYTDNAATDAGLSTPLPFTSGSWFGRGYDFNVVNNQFDLFNAVPASGQGRAAWFSAPHRDVLISDNSMTSGSVQAFGVLGLTVKDNKFRFFRPTDPAINIANDSPSSTTLVNFVVENNTIYDFDALSGANPGAISVIGLKGVIKNNACYGIGTFGGFATGFIVLNATTDEVHIEGNKLFKNGGSQLVLVTGAQNAKGKRFNNDTIDTSTQTFTSDGYKTGTFTPVIEGASSAGVGTYTTQLGRYTQVGNRCMFNIRLDWSAHTGTGAMQVKGLPFSSNSTSGNNPTFSIWADSLTYGSGTLSCWMVSGGSTINLSLVSNGAAATSVAMDTSGTLFITGQYEIVL